MSHALPIDMDISSGVLFVHVRGPTVVGIFQLGFMRISDSDPIELTTISTFKSAADILFEISGTNEGAFIQYVAPAVEGPFTVAWTVIGA
jgi:hypothetical protein